MKNWPGWTRTTDLLIQSQADDSTSVANAASCNAERSAPSSSPSSSEEMDCDLTALVDAWPALPAAVKAGIVAMVKVANE